MASRFLDLVAMATWSLAALLAVAVDAPRVVTGVLGLPLALLLPGLAVLALTHPDRVDSGRRRSMSYAERIPWGVLLSVALTLLLGMTLHLGAGMTTLAVTVSLALVTTLLLVLAGVVRYVEQPPLPQAPKHRGPLEWASLALVLALACVVAFEAYRVMEPASDRHHTVLAFIDPAPLLCHPLEWRDGALRYASNRASCPALADVDVGVANHEGRRVSYTLLAGWDVLPGDAMPPAPFFEDALTLPSMPDGPLAYQWTARLTVPPPPDEARSYLKIALVKEGSSEPPLMLQLRVDRA